MNDVILILVSIIFAIFSLCVLYSMPGAFLKQFEDSCKKAIKERDRKLEENEKLKRELIKYFFG